MVCGEARARGPWSVVSKAVKPTRPRPWMDEDDAQMQHEPEVIGVEDRAEGLVLADL